MATIIASIVVIIILLAMIYSGQRDGAYVAAYGLMRNLLAFLIAMTFYEPVSALVTRMAGGTHPGPDYYRVLSFAVLYGAVVGIGRWLRLTYTVPEVRCLAWLDRGLGAVFGLGNGIVVAGLVLVVWSMLPFVKYLPRDYGRVEPQNLWVDAGSGMLVFYDFATGPIPGSKKFVLEEPLKQDSNGNGRVDPGEFEDVNENGQWDPGWLWRYRQHADITREEVEAVE